MFEAPRQITPAVVGTDDVALGITPVAQTDFQKIWSVIWQGRTTILYATIAALALAILLVLAVPHQFTATTQIIIDPADLRAVANELTPSSQVSDTQLLQVESQVQVLTSDDVLRRVVESEGLDHDPEFARGPSSLREMADDMLTALGLGRHLVANPSLAALSQLRRRVQAKRAERTYVVDVSVTSEDPAKAARLANAVAQAYLTDQTQVRADAARQVSQSLSARLKELQDRVREAEDRVEAFKAKNNLVDVNGQLVNEQQLSNLNTLLEAARSRLAAAKARYEQVQQEQQSNDLTGAFPEAVQSPTITALRAQYAEIMRREAEETTTLGPRHPAVIDIQAQAERLRGMIVDEINRIALSARNEYLTAQANVATLEQNVEALKRTTIGTSEAMVGMRELQREAQASRAVYETFLTRARETGEQEQIDTKNIRVISKADLPLRRSWPPSNLMIALAAVLAGVAAGTGIVVMRDQVNGNAPRLHGKWRMAANKLWPAITTSPAIPVLAILPEVDVAFGLNALAEPNSRLAKEIRKVHEALRKGRDAPGNSRILVVAADQTDEDIAPVALMLAAQAAAKQRVLLLDADIERRTLASIDADLNEAGLVDVAIGRRPLAAAISRDPETHVSLLSFIAPNSRRDRRISDADVKHAFDQTRRFDMVIVTAMDSSRYPIARFFAGLVDDIVFVARTDQPSEDAIAGFVSRLGVDAQKIRGAVLINATAA
jgi:polysaccharide biosynthesis transport protein